MVTRILVQEQIIIEIMMVVVKLQNKPEKETLIRSEIKKIVPQMVRIQQHILLRMRGKEMLGEKQRGVVQKLLS